MYLSRIIINPACRQARKDLASPYEMHRTVMSAFPKVYNGRVLFRVDTARGKTYPMLYVQSDREADWHALEGIAGYLADSPDGYGNPAQRVFSPKLCIGDRLNFRLRANPTVKRNGKRIALLHEVDQMRWIARKIEAAGGKLLGVRVSPGERFHFRDKDDRDVVLFGVTFDGVLEVSSSVIIGKTIGQGIGSGKGFGFGLLSLARIY